MTSRRIRNVACTADADAPIAAAALLGRIAWIDRGSRRIRLDTPWRSLLGSLLARISPASRYTYSIAGATQRFLHPQRRVGSQPAPPAS